MMAVLAWMMFGGFLAACLLVPLWMIGRPRRDGMTDAERAKFYGLIGG